LALNDAVLDDTRRRLIKRRGLAPPAGSRATRALRRLDEVLDDLDRALAERAAA
jgi:NTE family protein